MSNGGFTRSQKFATFQKFFHGIMFCMCRVVLFTALYALLSLDSLLSKQAKDRK